MQFTSALFFQSAVRFSAKMTGALALSLALSNSAGALCSGQLSDTEPMVPNPQSASIEDMLDAQTATRDYVEGIENYLECRSRVISTEVHNMLVSRAERAAQGYNLALQAYLEGDKLLASEQ